MAGKKFHNKKMAEYKKKIWSKIPDLHLYDSENIAFSQAGCFNGFLVCNNQGYKDRLCNMYDINSAYPSILMNEEFPLSTARQVIDTNKIELEDLPKFKGLVQVIYRGSLEHRYANFDYEIFDGYFTPVMYETSKDQYYSIWLTTYDAYILFYMYKAEIMFIETGVKFTDLGKYEGIKDAVKEVYNDVKICKASSKENGKEAKVVFNIVTYGQLIELDEKKTEEQQIIFRNNRILTGIWVASYQRFRMFKLFQKYHKSIVYMDTDSIALDASVDFEEKVGNEIGNFKIVAENAKILVIRPKAYIIVKDNKVVEQKINGISKELTIPELKELCAFGMITVQEPRSFVTADGYYVFKNVPIDLALEYDESVSLNLE